MNEHMWITSIESATLLDYVAPFAPPRKLRLIACGFLRRHGEMLRFPRQRQAIAYAEQWAEGTADLDQREAIAERLEADAIDAPLFESYLFQAAAALLGESPYEAARRCRELLIQHIAQEEAYGVPPGQNEARFTAAARAEESRRQADILREIIANPFRPLTLSRAWLAANDSAARHLAAHIATHQRFDELPILADALEDAGCDHDALLRHLRHPSGHVRGCWALDAVCDAM
jgi:hypothetical protein